MQQRSTKVERKAQTKRARVNEPRLFGLLLAAVTLFVFWPVADSDFVNYDDGDYYTSNWNVLRGIRSGSVGWAFTTTHAANWHPLTWLSLMCDAEVFGAGPAGPHLVNLLFHATNTLLLFVLLWKLTRDLWPSVFVAACFGLHPLHVESVAWISERKDVLSTFFFFLALLSYVAYVRHRRPERATSSPPRENPLTSSERIFQPGSSWYVAAVISTALALMSKPMAVSLPLVMLLLDFWPLGRWRGGTFVDAVSSAKRLIVEKIPFFVLALGSSIVTILAQTTGGAVRNLASISMGARLENALVSYARYLGKTVWPARLSVLYPHPGHWPAEVVAVSLAVVATGFLVVLVGARKCPFLFTGWFWFVGTLVPVIGMVQVGLQSMADRYTYVPLIGVFVMVAWSMKFIVERWSLRPMWAGLICGGTLLACGVLTRHQLRYWKNGEALFSHAVAVTEHNSIALALLQNDLGANLYRQGRLDEAIDHYEQAIRLNPQYELAQNNFGIALASQGRYDEAIRHYSIALDIWPKYASAHINFGDALVAKGQIEEAILHYRQALQLDPHSVPAENNLGAALLRQGNCEGAITCFRRVIALAPKYASGYRNLANALVKHGQLGEAEACYRSAVELDPTSPETRYRFGITLLRQGKKAAARVQLEEALRLKPDYLESRQQLQALDGEGQSQNGEQ
jgi:tetratricopeptide (TPR) repeat protein